MQTKLFLCIAAAICFIGCDQPEPAPQVQPPEAQITFTDDLSDDCCNTAVAAGESVGSEYDVYIRDIKNALPDFAGFGKKFDRKIELLNASGKKIGMLWLAPAEKYTRVEGFNGYIDIAVAVDDSGKISGVAIGKNEETPRWITRIRNGGMLTRWNGQTPQQAAVSEVDGVTGATYSSNAIKGEVKAIFSSQQ